MSAIKPLPPAVATQIQSSAAFASLSDAVVGLVQNSLDAGSSNIHIDVDFARASFSVEDDGAGISSVDMSTNGNLARSHHTSKYENASLGALHGFRGIFLASLGAVSILTITSKRRTETSLHRFVMYQGTRLANGDETTTAHESLRNRRHGTRVHVQDLFGNMPVRVRQRPANDDSRRLRDRAFRNLFHEVVALIVSWNSSVNVTMQGSDAGQSERIGSWGQPGSESMESSVRDGFRTQRLCATLTQLIGSQHEWSTWVHTSASGKGIQVQGLISKIPSASPKTQFISLGIYPLDRSHGFKGFYEIVNTLTALSNFGTTEQALSREAKNTARTSSRSSAYEDRDPDRDLGRYPMFCIQFVLDSPQDGKVNRPADLSERDLSSMSSILEAMIIGFLENQRLHPRKRRRRKYTSKNDRPALPAPASDTQSDAMNGETNVFQPWPRMKSGIPVRSVVSPPKLTSGYIVDDHVEQRSNGGSSTPRHDFCPDFNEAEAIRLCQDLESVTNAAGDQLLSWQDERSGECLRINSRTGMVETLPEEAGPNRAHTIKSRHFGSKDFAKRLTLPRSGSGQSEETDTFSIWADEQISAWQNPVFENAEASIPSTIKYDYLSQILHCGDGHDFTSDRVTKIFRECQTAVETRITQRQLKNAQVVSQVDSKFILARIPSNDDGSSEEPDVAMILIDQHAADERIQVEKLLRELCRPSDSNTQTTHKGIGQSPKSRVATVDLQEPIVVDVSLHDQQILAADLDYFASWGILYRVLEVRNKLAVTALPSAIAERCRLDTQLIRGLLIACSRKRDEEGRLGTALDSGSFATLKEWEADRKVWMKYIHDCPEALLSMINSRSCRSAIMFNDDLTLEQCQVLVRQLAETALPFQCAHGRPSLLPLSMLRTSSP